MIFAIPVSKSRESPAEWKQIFPPIFAPPAQTLPDLLGGCAARCFLAE